MSKWLLMVREQELGDAEFAALLEEQLKLARVLGFGLFLCSGGLGAAFLFGVLEKGGSPLLHPALGILAAVFVCFSALHLRTLKEWKRKGDFLAARRCTGALAGGWTLSLAVVSSFFVDSRQWSSVIFVLTLSSYVGSPFVVFLGARLTAFIAMACGAMAGISLAKGSALPDAALQFAAGCAGLAVSWTLDSLRAGLLEAARSQQELTSASQSMGERRQALATLLHEVVQRYQALPLQEMCAAVEALSTRICSGRGERLSRVAADALGKLQKLETEMRSLPESGS